MFGASYSWWWDRSVDDMKIFLSVGLDKVSINSSAIKGEIITKGAMKFEISALLLQLTQKNKNSWEVFINGGRVETGIDEFNGQKKL